MVNHLGTPGPLRESTARPTLGLLVDWFEDAYQNAVLCGVLDAARDQDCNVICFPGGALASPARFGQQRNAIYALPGKENVDGLIVMAGSIGNDVGPEAIAAFLDRYRPLPMCSIAMPIPGVPSILVDNATGMRAALGHLLDHHGVRTIACIRGPEANPEAASRFGVYCDVLSERGLPLDPALTVTGDFRQASGAAAIGAIFGDRQLRPDAVFAFNDDMALGALRALRERRLRVPEDVALVGFDDVEAAEFANPPLTTVRQPLREQGSRAAEIVLAQLRGVAIDERVTLHTELVNRHSCGCYGLTGSVSASSFPASGDEPLAATLDCLRERLPVILERRFNASAAGLEQDWGQRLTVHLIDDLVGGPETRVVSWLNEKLERVRQCDGDLAIWHGVIDTIRRESLERLALPTMRLRLEDLCHEARRVLARALERHQADLRLRAERWARTLSRTGEALITSFDEVSLVSAVAQELPRLGIPTSFLSLYERGPEPLARARLILAHGGEGTGPELPAPSDYSCRQLVPAGMLPADRRYAYVVEPLFFKDDHLGFALFEIGPRDGAVYEALRDQLSAALKGALLVREVVEKDLERQRLWRDLEKRARQLQEAYDTLESNQEKLLVQEKMASLGRLTASIAHEMNTPLAAVRAALLEVERLVDEYAASVGDDAVLPADHLAIAREMRHGLSLATASARKAADYVRGIKTQTRDLSPTELHPFDAVPYVREALLLLSYALRQANCPVTFWPEPERVELHGSPGRLAQVVTNLVTNAIDASVPRGGGPIHITLERGVTSIDLAITDNGSGIAPEVIPMIFEPMFTTKPFGQGTGLGLTIVRDIVTRDFGGMVEVASTPGLGSTFTVRFPLPGEVQR
ncbi:MAG: substrate-binding domain-containing protein [Polyangiaceae bacterium]|nr:substrate-binding domain-containing protein [Polyangiaceae bacterium]